MTARAAWLRRRVEEALLVPARAIHGDLRAWSRA
jgi:hypothetical protein